MAVSLRLPSRRPWPAWLAAVVSPATLAAAVYAVFVFVMLRSYGFNPTGPIHIGDVPSASRFWTEQTLVEYGGYGYDGQYFFYLAHDPSLRADDPRAFLDFPAYRAGRILYPALAWVIALGRPEWLPWSMLGLNVLAALAGTLGALRVLHALGANRWLALAYAFSPAILLGLAADLAEPTAFALVAWGVALHLERRHLAAGGVLALATLARETSLLVPLGFALWAIGRRAWPPTIAYLAPLAVPAAWHLYVWHRWGAPPLLQGPPNFSVPLGGALYRVELLLGLRPPLPGSLAPVGSPLPELAIVAASVAVVLLGLARIATRRDAFAIQLWLHAAVALWTGPAVWVGIGSYTRVLGLLYLFYGLVVLTARRSTDGRSTHGPGGPIDEPPGKPEAQVI